MDSFDLDLNNGRPALYKSAAEGGLIVAAVSIAFGMILYVLNLHTEQWLAYVSLFISFVVLFFVGNDYKKKGGKAPLTYGQAFKFLMVAIIVAAVITGVFNYFYFGWIAPEIIDAAIDQQYEDMLSRGMSEDQAIQSMKLAVPWMTPITFAVTVVFSFIILGLIASLIIAALIKQETTSI